MGDERRRSPRIQLSVPLQVRWTNHEGKPTEEQTRTEVLNGAGARIHLKNRIELWQEVEIVNLENQESARARVVWAGEHSTQHGQRLGIEFLTPRAAFWGSQYST